MKPDNLVVLTYLEAVQRAKVINLTIGLSDNGFLVQEPTLRVIYRSESIEEIEGFINGVTFCKEYGECL